MLQVNINYWHGIDYKLIEDKSKLQVLITECMSLHELEMTRIALLKPSITETEHMNLEKGLRLYMLRVETAKYAL